jgi:hypothetical protein
MLSGAELPNVARELFSLGIEIIGVHLPLRRLSGELDTTVLGED